MSSKEEILLTFLNLIADPVFVINEKNEISERNNSASKAYCGKSLQELEKYAIDAAETLRKSKTSEIKEERKNVCFSAALYKENAIVIFNCKTGSKEGFEEESKKRLDSANDEISSVEAKLLKKNKDLKESNARLARSEEVFKALSETSQEIMFIVDENLNVIHVNLFAAKSFKASRENLIGKNLKQILPPDDFNQRKGAIKKVFEERAPIYYENVTEMPEGETWIGTRLVPLFNESKDVDAVLTVSRDITEKKRIELDNLAVNERFGKVFKHSPLAIIISKAEDGTIIDVNESCEKLFGYTTDELIGNKAFLLYKRPEDRAFFVDKLMREGAQKDYELRLKRKNKEERIVQISADYLEINEERCILSIIQDVTEETEANNTREALFDIADSAFKIRDINTIYKEIHKSLNKVLNAKNFYVAIHDKTSDIIDFPYYHDEKDNHAPSKRFGNGLTEYVLKRKTPALLSGEEIIKMGENKQIDIIGTVPAQWMGVPLIGESFTGVIALQHYEKDYQYTNNDKNILYFVSKQIIKVIDGKIKEKQLVQSETKHRMLLNSIKNPILSLTDNFNIYYCNEAYAEFVGKSIGELEGKSILEVFPSFEETKSFRAFRECIRTGMTQDAEGEVKGRGITLSSKIFRTKWGILAIAEPVNIKK